MFGEKILLEDNPLIIKQMKRLVFIVEGDSEIVFINKHVIPYLYTLGFTNPMNAQSIITNKKMNKKGGVVNYEYLKNDIHRVIAQENVIITTLINFFKLPTNFPEFHSNNIDVIINAVEEDIDYQDFIPYIQKYEFESLLFSSIAGFELLVDEDEKLIQLQQIIDEYPNPENINGGDHTAPSKRLCNIFPYKKVTDSDMILEIIGINTILEKCPRFSSWITQITKKLNE